MQVLIVEDDFISRRLLSRYLEAIATCDMAINGEEALGAVRATLSSGEHYRLVCLDIMMPGIDGQEVLQGIRALEDEYDVAPADRCRIVMTSALDKQEIIDQTTSALADEYLVKPIIKRNLMDVLGRLGLLAEDGVMSS